MVCLWLRLLDSRLDQLLTGDFVAEWSIDRLDSSADWLVGRLGGRHGSRYVSWQVEHLAGIFVRDLAVTRPGEHIYSSIRHHDEPRSQKTTNG